MEDKKGLSERGSSCLSRSHSVPSLSQTTSPENKTFTRSQSLPDLLLKSSFEEFTPDITVHTHPADSDPETSEVSISVPPPSSQSFSTSACRKRKSKGDGRRSEKKRKKDSFTTASASDYPAGMSGHMQDDTREREPHSTAGPSIIQLSSSDDDDSVSAEFYGKRARLDRMSGYDGDTKSVFRATSPLGGGCFPSVPFSPAQGKALLVPTRKETDDGGPSFDSSSYAFGIPTCSQSTEPTVPQHPRRRKTVLVLKESTVCTEGSKAQDALEVSVQSENDSGGDSYTLKMSTQPTHSHLQIPSSDPGWTERGSSCFLSHSHSVPSLSQTTSPENKTVTRSQSLPDLLKSSFEEFTPVHTDPTDSDPETSEVSISVPPPSSQSFSTSACRKRKFKRHSEKKHKKDSFTTASIIDDPICMLEIMQDDTREIEPHSTAGPSIIQLFSSDDEDSDSDDFYRKRAKVDWMSEYDELLSGSSSGACLLSTPSLAQGQASFRDSSCLPPSHSVPLLSQISSSKDKTFKRSQSLPDMLIKSSFEEFTPDSTLHSPELLCLSGMSGPMQDDTREMELMSPSAGGVPYSLELSSRDFAEFYGVCEGTSQMTWDALPLFRIRRAGGYVPTTPSLAQDQALHLPDREDTDDDGPSFDNSSFDFSIYTQSMATEGLLQRRGRVSDYKRSTVCTQGSSAQDPFEMLGDMSGSMQNDTREMEPHSLRNLCIGGGYVPTTPSQAQGEALHLPDRKDTDDDGPSFDNSSYAFSRPSCSQSTAPTVWGPPCPQDSPVVLQDSTVYTGGSRAQDNDVLMETETSDTALDLSVTNNQSTHSHFQLSSSDPGWSERDSSCSSRSHSVPSLSQTTESSSFEEFTPDISVDEDDETYWFQCSSPGLYQCSVTGLVFHMEGEGDVVYRTVPWDRRLLAQHHKQPAGPLFDIKCLQQSVCQLHLPHCEIRSTGGCEFLSVAHVNDEGIQFIVPQKITETHVIINITGFSAFGNVKDEDSPPDPVRALVLLFYRPPADPDPESLLNVLLLPVNIVLRDVLRTRKKLFEDEFYIETSPHCKLCPKQEYTLSTCPEDDSVLVQPSEAEFYCDNYDNYFPSFQVILEKLVKYIKLFLRETKSSKSVWERRVCLSSTAVKRSCGPSALNLPPNDRLLDIRSSFIDGISGPVLKSLLDKLLEKTVMTDSERESADEIRNHRDKARFVVDTVRKKGEAASSEMIQFLCEVDPFLCEHLGLI